MLQGRSPMIRHRMTRFRERDQAFAAAAIMPQKTATLAECILRRPPGSTLHPGPSYHHPHHWRIFCARRSRSVLLVQTTMIWFARDVPPSASSGRICKRFGRRRRQHQTRRPRGGELGKGQRRHHEAGLPASGCLAGRTEEEIGGQGVNLFCFGNSIWQAGPSLSTVLRVPKLEAGWRRHRKKPLAHCFAVRPDLFPVALGKRLSSGPASASPLMLVCQPASARPSNSAFGEKRVEKTRYAELIHGLGVAFVEEVGQTGRRDAEFGPLLAMFHEGQQIKPKA